MRPLLSAYFAALLVSACSMTQADPVDDSLIGFQDPSTYSLPNWFIQGVEEIEGYLAHSTLENPASPIGMYDGSNLIGIQHVPNVEGLELMVFPQENVSFGIRASSYGIDGGHFVHIDELDFSTQYVWTGSVNGEQVQSPLFK
jgi:hypothetical protein